MYPELITCDSCDGMGGADWATDSEVYDEWHECESCDGTGEVSYD